MDSAHFHLNITDELLSPISDCFYLHNVLFLFLCKVLPASE